MEQYVVTISRQFGALGRTVAQCLSGMLGVEFWDRDIVEATAKRLGQSLSTVSDVEETAKYSLFPTRKERISLASYSLDDEIFDTERNIILDAAKQSSCIIVGRCSDYLLRDMPNRLSVYLFAPLEQRVKNCIERLEMDEKTARRTIREMDAARGNYQRKYCPGTKSPFEYKDMLIDSSRFGPEGTAKIIAAVVKQNWG